MVRRKPQEFYTVVKNLSFSPKTGTSVYEVTSKNNSKPLMIKQVPKTREGIALAQMATSLGTECAEIPQVVQVLEHDNKINIVYDCGNATQPLSTVLNVLGRCKDETLALEACQYLVYVILRTLKAYRANFDGKITSEHVLLDP